MLDCIHMFSYLQSHTELCYTPCCCYAGALHTSKSGHSCRGMDSQRAGVFESNGATCNASVS